MKTLRMKISTPGQPDWFASHLVADHLTPEAAAAALNRQSKARRIGATYSPATEAEYWNYRNAVAAMIASDKGRDTQQ